MIKIKCGICGKNCIPRESVQTSFGHHHVTCIIEEWELNKKFMKVLDQQDSPTEKAE